MHPKLLEIPFIHLPIYSYGFMVMTGFLVAIFIISRRAERDNISPEVIFDIGLIAMVSGIVGARIFYLIYFSEQFDFSLFNIADGGLSIIGAVFGFFLPFTVRYFRSGKIAQDKEQKQSSKQSQPNIGLTFKSFFYLLIISIACAVVLGRAAYLALHYSQYAAIAVLGPDGKPMIGLNGEAVTENAWNIFFVWQGGLVFYGGVVLAIITIIIYLKMQRLAILKVGDLLMPGILLGLAFGRIGCFLNGCCYGKVSYRLWAACFPPIHGPQGKLIGSPAFLEQLQQNRITVNAQTSLPVHPTELYESLLAILIFGLLTLIWLHKDRFSADGKQVEGRHGLVVVWAGIFYGIVRFTLEFFRGDNKSFVIGLSYSQLVSIGIFITSIILWIWINTRRKEKPVSPV